MRVIFLTICAMVSVQAVKPVKCPGNQIAAPNECGSGCIPTCTDPHPTMCPAVCRPCICPPKKPILHKGKCIKLKKCPNAVKCPSNQIAAPKGCGSGCVPTCTNPQPFICPAVCRPCICPPKLPIFHQGRCIKLLKCPNAVKLCHPKGQPKDQCIYMRKNACTILENRFRWQSTAPFKCKKSRCRNRGNKFACCCPPPAPF